MESERALQHSRFSCGSVRRVRIGGVRQCDGGQDRTDGDSSAKGSVDTFVGAARIGRVAGGCNILKYLDSTIDDHSMPWRQRRDGIADEARFDGTYIVGASLEIIETDATVEGYQNLPGDGTCSPHHQEARGGTLPTERGHERRSLPSR